MSKLDKDQVIADFTAAYQQAHGKKPHIEAAGGWFSVDGGKNVRLAQLAEAAAELSTSNKKPAKAAAKPPHIPKQWPAPNKPNSSAENQTSITGIFLH